MNTPIPMTYIIPITTYYIVKLFVKIEINIFIFVTTITGICTSQTFEPHNQKSECLGSESLRILPEALLLGILAAAQSSDSIFLAFSKRVRVHFTRSGKNYILPTFLVLRQRVFIPGLGLNIESGSWSSLIWTVSH